MPRKFDISITLGDDAMLTKDDVYQAVCAVMEEIDLEGNMEYWDAVPDFRVPVLDANGNVTGFCKLTGIYWLLQADGGQAE